MSGATSPPDGLISGQVLARNALWNILGQVVPVGVALLAVPVLLDRLGAARFGILSLIWVLVGYFNLFDLGFGRALTQVVGDRLGQGRAQEVPALVRTYLVATTALGAVAGGCVALAAGWLGRSALQVPEAIEGEVVAAFVVMAVSIPLAVSTPGLRGCLEAYQRFDLATALRLPSSVALVLGPVAALPFTTSLVGLTAVLVVVRLATWISHLWVCGRLVPGLGVAVADRRLLRAMSGQAGWITVSNVVAPLMAYLDRFLIAAVASAAAVAYYVTPYDLVTRLSVLPLAVGGVVFPAVAVAGALAGDRRAALLGSSSKITFLVMLPVCFVVGAFAEEGLALWLDDAFAREAADVLRIMAVGTFVNSLAQVPFGLVQGVGRADLAAKLHVLEVPFYLLLLWPLVGRLGIEGAALAWTARVAVDTTMLFALAARLVGLPTARALSMAVAAGIGTAAIAAIAALPLSTLSTALVAAAALAGFPLVAWRTLDLHERSGLRALAPPTRRSARLGP